MVLVLVLMLVFVSVLVFVLTWFLMHFHAFMFQDDLALWGVRVPGRSPSARCCLALAPDKDVALGWEAGAVAVAAREKVHGVPRRLRQRRKHGWGMRHA